MVFDLFENLIMLNNDGYLMCGLKILLLQVVHPPVIDTYRHIEY